MVELVESVALGLFAEVAARLYPEGEEVGKAELFALYEECMGVVVKAGKLRPARTFSGDRDGDSKPRFNKRDSGGDDGYAPRKKPYGEKSYGEKSYGGGEKRSTGGMYAVREDRGGDRGAGRGPAGPGRGPKKSFPRD